MTSGLGSPTTSQWIMTVSPSTASVDLGLVTNKGTLEYLKHEWKLLYCEQNSVTRQQQAVGGNLRVRRCYNRVVRTVSIILLTGKVG